MKSGASSKNYSDLLGYGSRSPKHYRNGFAGLKSSPRPALTNLANIGNGSDKDSLSGRSRKSRTRQGI